MDAKLSKLLHGDKSPAIVDLKKSQTLATVNNSKTLVKRRPSGGPLVKDTESGFSSSDFNELKTLMDEQEKIA